MVLGVIFYLVPLTVGGVILYMIGTAVFKLLGEWLEASDSKDINKKIKKSKDRVAKIIERNRQIVASQIQSFVANKETPQYLEVSATSCEPIDMGLPSGTLWGSCNLGATVPEIEGDLFAWGEPKPKSEFTETNSVHYGVSLNLIDKEGYEKKDIAGTEFDAVTVNLGEGWTVPTNEQFEELLEICDCEQTTKNGVEGLKVTSENGNSIFLPISENLSAYMSSSINNDPKSEWIKYNGELTNFIFPSTVCGSSFSISSETVIPVGMQYGLYVRPVCKKKLLS